MPARTLRSRMMERLWAGADSAYRAKLLETLPVEPSARLLDVGCDDGAWTEELRQRVTIPPKQVYGLEIVQERANLARARGFDVGTGDLEASWPFADDSMDIVHANQVIEHVKRLDHFVEELKRVLAPRGLALVCTENLASWHNVGALALGYQPFSVTNISNLRPIGNRFALHAGEEPVGESWQHIHVVTLTALRDLFLARGVPAITPSRADLHRASRRSTRGTRTSLRSPRGHPNDWALSATPDRCLESSR